MNHKSNLFIPGQSLIWLIAGISKSTKFFWAFPSCRLVVADNKLDRLASSPACYTSSNGCNYMPFSLIYLVFGINSCIWWSA